MQSWFLSWTYADESGRAASGWNTRSFPVHKSYAEITSEYIQGIAQETGLDARRIILVAFNKI
jgi:hypothetical protein